MSDRVDDVNSEINKKFKNHCWDCNYHSNDLKNLNRHMKSRKHKNKISELYPIILVSNCIECNIEFCYSSLDNKCWECKIKNIIFIKYDKCNKYRGNFCKIEDCYYCYNRSFVSCSKHIYLNIDNNIDPRQIEKYSNKKCKFTCYKCDHNFFSLIKNISNGIWCSYCYNGICKDTKCIPCFNRSFASDSRSKFWDYELNDFKPRDLSKMSNKMCWFKCNNCPHSFDIILYAVTGKGHWCRYCSHHDLCLNNECKFCFNNSFASYYLSKYWSSNNEISPRYVFPNCEKLYIFICLYCEKEFKRSPYNVNKNGCVCSNCTHKTEKKFYEWLILKYNTLKIINQPKFEWCKNVNYLPFDFETIPLDLLIEIDGVQHFKQVSNWKSPKLTQERDVYKMKQAIKNNKSIIRISQEDVWYDRYDWKSDITQYIKKYDKPTVIYLSKNKNLYNDHKLLMNIDKLKFNNNIIQIITKYI